MRPLEMWVWGVKFAWRGERCKDCRCHYGRPLHPALPSDFPILILYSRPPIDAHLLITSYHTEMKPPTQTTAPWTLPPPSTTNPASHPLTNLTLLHLHRPQPARTPTAPQQTPGPVLERRPDGKRQRQRKLQPHERAVLPGLLHVRAAGLTRRALLALARQTAFPTMRRRRRRGVKSAISQVLVLGLCVLVVGEEERLVGVGGAAGLTRLGE